MTTPTTIHETTIHEKTREEKTHDEVTQQTPRSRHSTRGAPVRLLTAVAAGAALALAAGAATAGSHGVSEKEMGQQGKAHTQAPAPMKAMEENGTRFISGGVGDAEQAELAERMGSFDLRVKAVRPDGAYLGRYDVRIERESGDLVLETRTAGPVLLVDLAPGTYRVRADEAGRSAAGARVEISDGMEAQTLVLRLEEQSDASDKHASKAGSMDDPMAMSD